MNAASSVARRLAYNNDGQKLQAISEPQQNNDYHSNMVAA